MEAVRIIKSHDAADEKKEFDEEIKDRLSNELIVALIGPVASEVSTTAKLLKQYLESNFGYDVPEIIKISSFISKHSKEQLIGNSLSERITSFQDAGNRLRKDFGYGILAKLAIRSISSIRHKDGFRKTKSETGEEIDVPLPKRRVHIIDSLKHPDEIFQLREVYGNILWVIGVSAADHVRAERLESLGVQKSKIHEILNRDMGEKAEFGQKVRKAFASSDFFVRNDSENHDSIKDSLDRFLDILFGTQLHNPTAEESAMFHAATAASRSACMSRQVGAALINSEGDLISVGWNDVPKFGGGLYNQSVNAPDNRCFHWRERLCHNDYEKGLIENRIVNGLMHAIAKNDLALELRTP